MFSRLWQRPEPVGTAGQLREFIAARAAFVSQKCTVEYCRARAGLNWDKLFKEQGFLEAMERCRWEALGAVAIDVAEIAEGQLRPAWTGPLPDLAAAVAGLLREALDAHGRPAGGARSWEETAAEGAERLARAQLAPPRPAYLVAEAGGARLFDVLPIHGSLRDHDRPMVVNGVRFQMTRMAEDLQRRLRPEEVARDLAGTMRAETMRVRG